MEETFISTMMCILRKNQLITLSTKKDNSHGTASQVATDPNRTNKSIYMEQDIHRWVCKTSTLTRISKVLMVYITIQKGSTFNQPQGHGTTTCTLEEENQIIISQTTIKSIISIHQNIR